MPGGEVYRRALARAVENDDAGALLLHFRAAALRKPMATPGAKLLRSDTIGRLLVPGTPALDFGLVLEDQVIHLRFQDFTASVPQAQREHWLAHLVVPAHSPTLLRMHANPAACYDDGPIRHWEPPTDDSPAHDTEA